MRYKQFSTDQVNIRLYRNKPIVKRIKKRMWMRIIVVGMGLRERL